MKAKMAKKFVKKLARSYDRPDDQPIAITPIEYSGLQAAYDHFNRELFDGVLPDVFITYQRKARSQGYFAVNRFSGRVGKFVKHELALNPDAFIGQSDSQVCQTLVHEMHHAWQHHSGTPASRGYHNMEWAAKMKSNGLQPSSTGMVGGKETGQRMLDYPIPGGRFEQSFNSLLATRWRLNLQSAHQSGPKPGTNSKTKFTCMKCGKQNVWGKPDTDVTCHACERAEFENAGYDMDEIDAILDKCMMRAATAQPDGEMIPTPVTAPSYEQIEPTMANPKRGRPKGSKNKPKRGRPKSKNKPPLSIQSYETERPADDNAKQALETTA